MERNSQVYTFTGALYPAGEHAPEADDEEVVYLREITRSAQDNKGKGRAGPGDMLWLYADADDDIVPMAGPSRSRATRRDDEGHRQPQMNPFLYDHDPLDDPEVQLVENAHLERVRKLAPGTSRRHEHPEPRRQSLNRSLSPMHVIRAPNDREEVVLMDEGWGLDVTRDAQDQDMPQPQPATVEDGANEDLASTYLATVLAVVTDVKPEYASELIQSQMRHGLQAVAEVVINYLFDHPSYPKIERRGNKRRHSDESERAESSRSKEGEPAPKQNKVDWASLDRQLPGGAYLELALEQLCQDFRYVTKHYIRLAFQQHRMLYYPTFFYLQEVTALPGFGGAKKTATPVGKGKGRHLTCEVFEQERRAVLAVLTGQAVPVFAPETEGASGSSSKALDQAPAAEVLEEAPEGEGIECGCCFSSYLFENMTQCADGHLFCKTCAKMNAETIIGQRKADIRCMDQSGCKQEFPESEIKRFLDAKALDLLERIQTEKAVEAAGLEGLEECPFCDFKYIIENDQERLFRCENESCGIVSCRQCKKEDHLPKTCAEADSDRGLDARHAVEEAMTEALMRKCPQCQKPFVKEAGCNKMRCPHCSTLSCYACRKIITGYDHFNEQPGNPTVPKNPTKACIMHEICSLWDDVEKRHHEEVAEAARRAQQQQQNANPDLDATVLKVDLPAARNAPKHARQPYMPVVHRHRHHVHPVGLRLPPIQAPPIDLPNFIPAPMPAPMPVPIPMPAMPILPAGPYAFPMIAPIQPPPYHALPPGNGGAELERAAEDIRRATAQMHAEMARLQAVQVEMRAQARAARAEAIARAQYPVRR